MIPSSYVTQVSTFQPTIKRGCGCVEKYRVVLTSHPTLIHKWVDNLLNFLYTYKGSQLPIKIIPCEEHKNNPRYMWNIARKEMEKLNAK